MRKLLYAVLLLLMPVLTGSATADDEPAIVAEDSYARDSRIVMTLEGLDDVKYRARWVVRSDDGSIDPDFRIHHLEHGVSIWAPPGNYETICTVAVILTAEPDTTEIGWLDLWHEWKVEGKIDPPDDPEDPEDPDDPDGPDPPVPADFSDFTTLIQKLAAPVKVDDRKAEAALIAAAYRQAVKDEYETYSDLVDASSSAVVSELGLNKFLRWRPLFTRLTDALVQAQKDSRLNDDMDDWHECWAAIAAGFDKVENREAGSAENTDE